MPEIESSLHDPSTLISIAHCLFLSHLDYCCSLLIKTHSHHILKLQSVINTIVHLIFPHILWPNQRFHLKSSPLAANELDPSWRTAGIEFKIFLLVWKYLNVVTSNYLWYALSLDNNEHRKTVCSSSDSMLKIPWTHPWFRESLFVSAALSLSNSLPNDPQQDSPFLKIKLKTLLFSKCCSWIVTLSALVILVWL